MGKISAKQMAKDWFDKHGNALYEDHVVPLELALYGHPDAGGVLGASLLRKAFRSRLGGV